MPHISLSVDTLRHTLSNTTKPINQEISVQLTEGTIYHTLCLLVQIMLFGLQWRGVTLALP